MWATILVIAQVYIFDRWFCFWSDICRIVAFRVATDAILRIFNKFFFACASPVLNRFNCRCYISRIVSFSFWHHILFWNTIWPILKITDFLWKVTIEIRCIKRLVFIFGWCSIPWLNFQLLKWSWIFIGSVLVRVLCIYIPCKLFQNFCSSFILINRHGVWT